MTDEIRKKIDENNRHLEQRKYLKHARDEMKNMYIHRIVNVLGSNDKL